MRPVALIALICLAACGEKTFESAGDGSLKMASTHAELPPPAAGAKSALADTVLPQIAYAYQLGFRLPADRVAAAQSAHLKLCDTLGPARCRLVKQERRGGEMAGGHMAFEVESKLARGFADRMDAVIGDAGGSTTSRAISAEDLSKSIIDTEARIRAKQALADRLLELIRKRDGKVGELVEAERAFADAQEELDAARSGLETMRRRVAMSRIDADYAAIGDVGGGGWAIRDAIDSAGRTLGMSIAVMIGVMVAALPWLAVFGLIAWIARRWRRRKP